MAALLSVIALAVVVPAPSSKVVLPAMVRVPVPMAVLCSDVSVPPSSEVPPVYVLAPDKVRVLVFDLVKTPAPLITPESVWLAVVLTWSVPALTIAPA